ncbi:MAG: hypothetical protein IPK61_05520 [Saprospiraceae bacterium]|nr:hypothetical protein [Saprospiraceae bacterium]
MNNKDLIHILKYAWEPPEKSNEGAYHIYDYWKSVSNIPVIHDFKYMCGLKVSAPNELSDLSNIEMQTEIDPALHKALCQTCKKLMNKKLP